ncbi:MAG: hypothetical protein ACJ79E_13365, partial [Anaeromyxobacteraceae bacterium]
RAWTGPLAGLAAAPAPPPGGAPGTIVVGDVVSLARADGADLQDSKQLPLPRRERVGTRP